MPDNLHEGVEQPGTASTSAAQSEDERSDRAGSESSRPFALSDNSDSLPAENPRRDDETGGAAQSSLSESHNSPSCDYRQPDLPFRLTGSQAKTAFALRHNAAEMCHEFGVERVGFATFTVGDTKQCGEVGCRGCKRGKHFVGVRESAEASRRWNDLNRTVIGALFERLIIVSERHKSGLIHFHCLGVVRTWMGDIRTGFDFSAAKGGDYSSASLALRQSWKFLRAVLPQYGFGRAELTPVRKSGEAVSSYVSKYVEKNLFNRLQEDVGKKLVRYVGFSGKQLKPNSFSWFTPRAREWRIKAQLLASSVTLVEPSEVAYYFGPRWAYKLTGVMGSASLIYEGHYDLVQDMTLRMADSDLAAQLRFKLDRRWDVQYAEYERTRERRHDEFWSPLLGLN